jgi:hypothetical protein
MKLFLITLLISAQVLAGFPPTTSKLEGETTPSTTFNYQFPHFTGTRTGITTSLDLLSIAGGGTGNSAAMPNMTIPFSDGTKLITDGALTFDTVGDGIGHTNILNVNGSANFTSFFNTVSSFPYALDGGHRFTGALFIDSGTPISDTDYFINAFTGSLVFNDDYTSSSFTKSGVSSAGSYMILEGASGKTADKVSNHEALFAIASGSAGGTVTEAASYSSNGILDLGGTLTITNYYGYKHENILGTNPTNEWGVYVAGPNAENYFESGVAINTTSKKATNSSVGLEIGGTTKAMRLPVLTTAQKNALTPLAGMEVYDSDLGKISVYNGTAWVVDTASLTTLTAGSVPFADANGYLAQDNANFNWDDANNRLMVGTGSNSFTVNGSTKGSGLTVSGAGTSNAYDFSVHKHSGTDSPGVFLIRSRGNESTPAPVNSGDVLGEMNFLGYDGTDFEYGAKIESTVDGNPSSNDMPAALNFYTVPDGGVTPTLAMKIGQDRVVAVSNKAVIGGTTPAASTVLDLQSTTGALKLPSMTTTQRNALTASDGMMIYNSTMGVPQCYYSSSWGACVRDSGGTATSLAASGSITAYLNVFKQTWIVQSSGGAVTLSTTPFGATAPITNSELVLIGQSDTDTVTIPANDAAKGVLGYNVTLGRGQTATYKYNTTMDRYVLTAVGKVDLTLGVAGVLPIANGGTNNGSLAVTAGGVLYTDGTKMMNVGAGTSGYALTSGGAGAPSWTSVLTNPMTTGGDVIYGGASGVPARLANGSSGQVLTSGGGTAAPTWTAGPGMVLIDTQTPLGAAEVEFVISNPTQYNQYVIVADRMVPSTDAVNGYIQISTGSGYKTTNYTHQSFRWTTSATGQAGSTSDSVWNLTGGGENFGNGGAGESISFEVKIFGANAVNTRRRATWTMEGQWASASYVSINGSGSVTSDADFIDKVKFYFSSGNISSGKIALYGLK